METKGKVLIADQDRESRETLADFLLRENFSVDTTSVASEVIQKIQNVKIDVLIMDVELKGMKGYEIIIWEQGIFFYAVKPLDLKEIRLAVNDALKKLTKK